jgi:hypothetical protein
MVCTSPRAVPALLAVVLVLGAVPLACGDEGSGGDGDETGEEAQGLSVTLDRESVEPGGTIEARVVNETDSEYTYGAAYELEREVDGEFERVPVDRAFIQIAYIAAPGETGPPVAVELPRDAEPGSWRVILDRNAAGVGELAAGFEITGRGG